MKSVFGLSLYTQTLIAMAIGVGAGLVFGPRTEPLGVIATILVGVIKWVAVPLVFLTIVETLSRAEFRSTSIKHLFLVSTLNATGAILIAAGIVRFFQPGKYLPLSAHLGEKVGFAALRRFGELAHGNPVAFFFQNPMMLAICIALVLGFTVLAARRRLSASNTGIRSFDRAIAFCLRWIARALQLIVQWIPLAVFAAIAKVVGKSGLGMAGGLLAYVLVCVGGMALQIALVYRLWIVHWARMPWRLFWKEAREPAIHGFGINSSLATLPLTLGALRRLGVSDASARLSACVGTNFNNDGILLYEVAAVFFLCQSYGIELSFIEQGMTAVVCIIATIGVAGVPEAGVIALTLVLSAVGLPAESLTLLLTVDWFVARCRSFTNVTADMAVAVAIDGFQGRNTEQTPD